MSSIPSGHNNDGDYDGYDDGDDDGDDDCDPVEGCQQAHLANLSTYIKLTSTLFQCNSYYPFLHLYILYSFFTKLSSKSIIFITFDSLQSFAHRGFSNGS